MKIRNWSIPTAIPLIVILAVAFFLRVQPYHAVFGGTFVSFLETDSYNQMEIAKSISGMPFWTAIHYTIANNNLWPGTVALFGHFMDMELAGVWLPLILGLLTVALTYGIGTLLFNRTIGILSALFVAIIPSELLNRTLLGYADHHAMEVFLMVAAIFCLLKALKVSRVRNRWTLLTSVSLFLFLANWTGGMVLIGILAVAGAVLLIMRLSTHNKSQQKEYTRASTVIGASLFCSVTVYMVLGGYARYFGLLAPSVAPSALAGVGNPTGQVFSEGLATFFAPVSSRTISEIMPMFFPFGTFNLGVVLTNLNFFAIAFIGGMFLILAQMPNSSQKWLLVVWTTATLLMALDMRRFLYYFTINIAIVSAYCLVWLASKFKGDRMLNLSAILMPVMLISLLFANLVGRGGYIQMSPEWQQALTWLKAQPIGTVTAWSDYGHWISYETEDTPNLLPGPGGKEVAQLFLSANDAQANDLMKVLGTKYLIADLDLLQQKIPALYKVSETANSATLVRDTLLYRLLTNTNVPSTLVPAYQNTSIIIYEVSGG